MRDTLKDIFLGFFIGIFILVLVAGCGTTLNLDESFDAEPIDSTVVQATQTSLPFSSRIQIVSATPTINITGSTGSVENSATVNVYTSADVLLGTANADTNGIFAVTLVNPGVNTFVIKATAGSKTESYGITFTLF